MIISIDAENVPDKIQHPFMINALKKRNREEFSQLDKKPLQKHTANILKSDRLNEFSLRSDKARMSSLTTLI